MNLMKDVFSHRSAQVEAPVSLAHYLRSLLTCLAFTIQLSPANAQELQKNGKEHDHLKRLVGTWDAETEFGNGTMTYKMELDGLWLVSDFDGEFGGIKFQGKGLDTFDSTTKKYRSVWVDSFSTVPRIMEGSFDNTEKVMTMTGEGRGPDGSTAKYKSVIEIRDIDIVSFELFIVEKDGKDKSLVTIAYKRKKVK